MFSSSPLLWRKPPAALQYAAPVLAVVSALFFSHLAALHLESAPVSLFLCAVMISAWFGGVGPGLLATVLAALAFYNSFLGGRGHQAKKCAAYIREWISEERNGMQPLTVLPRH